MHALYGRAKAFATSRHGMAALGTAGVGALGLQAYFGHVNNFIERKFTTTKDADALVEFYQSEDLLKIIAFDEHVFKIMLSGTRFEDVEEGETLRGKALDGKTTVSSIPVMPQEVMFTLTEEEIDTTGDGETDTVGAFTKVERFTAFVPILYQLGIKVLIFDTTWEYGFHRQSDGTLEVCHRGLEFIGPWPALPIMMWHQGSYAVWAVKKHVNSDFFGSDEDEAWEQKEKQLANLPLDALHQFIHDLGEKHEAAISVGREPTQQQKITLQKLRTLDFSNLPDTIQIEQKRGKNLSSTTIKLEDPEAQAALNAALKQIAEDNGSRHMSKAMEKLVQHPEIEWKPVLRRTTSGRIFADAEEVTVEEAAAIREAVIEYGAFGKDHARDGQPNKVGAA